MKLGLRRNFQRNQRNFTNTAQTEIGTPGTNTGGDDYMGVVDLLIAVVDFINAVGSPGYWPELSSVSVPGKQQIY